MASSRRRGPGPLRHHAAMRGIEAEIFRARTGEKWTQRAEAYPQAITMLDDEEGFKHLTRAEKARRKTEKCKELTVSVVELLRPDQPALKLTASIGVAVFPAARVDTVEDLFARADSALYRAKADGRNRVRQ